MVHEQKSGGRYSRRVQRKFNLTDPAEMLELIARMKARSFRPFLDQLADEIESARAFLSGLGLPTQPRIGSISLDHYVNQAGHKRDSSADLCARLIMHAEKLGHQERERALEAAFRMGQLNVLSRVYGLERMDARTRGGKPKRRAWADHLAVRLVNDGVHSPRDAKSRLPTDHHAALELDDDHAVYLLRESDSVICIDPISSDYREIGALKWGAFEKNYLRPLRLGQQRR